uniref:Uncharacterized protein n=1 Tax=Ananas comosus var. bracteatus TaxID=296719 RepID=A0A6V7PHN6_ANACO|nr:unnamed protein product [Ananas comosus var. bracteatus]
MRPPRQAPCLADGVEPSDGDHALQVERRAQGPEMLRELARRSEDEGEDAEGSSARRWRMGRANARGFAAPRLGDAEDVVAGEDAGDEAELDGGGAPDPELAAGGDGPLGEADAGKGGGAASRTRGAVGIGSESPVSVSIERWIGGGVERLGFWV